MAQRTAHDAPASNRFARSGALLLVGTLVANLLSYAFFAVLSRRMDQADLGGVGSMINLSVIAGIPALGLQLVAARIVARRSHDAARLRYLEIRLLRASLVLGIAAAVVVAALAPSLARLLDVEITTVAFLGLSMIPLAVLLAAQGLLQGRERFATLSLVLALTGIGKFLAAVLADRVGAGVGPVILLYSTALVLVAACGAGLVVLPSRNQDHPTVHTPTRPGATARLIRLVAAAAVPTSGLLFLASVDVLLARHHLSAAESGQYTVGALFEKAAFWGTSFLATLFYPAMTDPVRRRGALIRALVVTAAVGLAGTVVTVALGEPLVKLVGGPAFVSLGPDLWRFTALGAALSLVQILAYAGVAVATVRMGLAMWLVAAGAFVWVGLRADTVTGLVTTMLAFAVVLVAIGLVIERRSLRPTRPDDHRSRRTARQ